jgi:hypothetical protein
MKQTHSVSRQAAFAVLLLCLFCTNLSAGTIYVQTNLVSDVPGLAATKDPNLKNPWSRSFSPTSPFWISVQSTGLATLYDGAGNIIPLVVTIPKIGVPSGATHQVFNGTTDFNLPDGMRRISCLTPLTARFSGGTKLARQL